MTGDEQSWKLLEIHKAALVAVTKANSRYLNWLLGSMAVLWGWQALKPAATKVVFLGVELPTTFLWIVAPAVLTCLNLARIGSINAIGPIYRRISDCSENLPRIWFPDLDLNRNMLDYFGMLRLRPEVEIESRKYPQYRNGDLQQFSYPLVIALAVVTTLAADYPSSSWGFSLYVRTLAAIQIVYGVRIWYRSVCRFFGIRREYTTF